MKKKQENMKLQWIKFIVVLVLYLLFLLWLKSWLGLIVIPFIYDAYITKEDKLAMVEGCRISCKFHHVVG